MEEHEHSPAFAFPPTRHPPARWRLPRLAENPHDRCTSFIYYPTLLVADKALGLDLSWC